MSVEARELTSEAWTRWQGHVINGLYPLGRFLGCSDHSGVYLTKSASRAPSEVAIKLVPANRAIAESHLPRWKRASGLSEPRLLPLFEWGGCQLEGLPYLYAVMEYADQTLAQLLLHRALTDGEAREMLPPILEALAFLHGRDLVQGQLKPANILVVGDQLKLASDTIRRVGEDTLSANAPSAYDPPEARHGRSSPAGDIWALGVSVFEALTRRSPPSLGERGDAIVLPADFSPAFRDVVTRCLSARPQDRPSIPELVAWAQGRSSGPAAAPAVAPAAAPTNQPAALAQPEPRAPESAPARPAPRQVSSEAAPPPHATVPLPQRRGLLVVVLGVVVLALGWAGAHVLRSHHELPAQASAVPVATGVPSQIPIAATHAAADTRAPVSAASSTVPSGAGAATAPLALHQVIPAVPWSARRTIHGHVKVWVRVIVNQDGSVFAALVDRAGPSRYFRRLAIEAAKNWTFAPTDSTSRRLMQVRFEFSRDGTTGRAVALP